MVEHTCKQYYTEILLTTFDHSLKGKWCVTISLDDSFDSRCIFKKVYINNNLSYLLYYLPLTNENFVICNKSQVQKFNSVILDIRNTIISWYITHFESKPFFVIQLEVV